MLRKTHKHLSNQNGFTLVEVMVAMVVFAIGILTLNLMQTSAIDGNASANRMTNAATWASDRVEQIFALEYDDALLADTDGDGTGEDTDATPGVDDDGGNFGLGDDNTTSADHNFSSPDGGEYTVLWNVAVDEPMPDMKTIHIIVQRNDLGVSKSITFEYMKSKFM